jgi:Ca-activated chloride channel family protein
MPEDRTLSPYFVVRGRGPAPAAGTVPLPLKRTHVRAAIRGVIAAVTVTQEYRNEGGEPIEATYVFPASTRAAVHGMTMTIGDRVRSARIMKKADAAAVYEQAKQSGQSASLLEQTRPNVFQMSIANIMPGDTVRVELEYTEVLVPEKGEYELVYPAVVAPRYQGAAPNLPGNALAPGGSRAGPAGDTGPHRAAAAATARELDIEVDLSAGLPIQAVSSPTHTVAVTGTTPSRARIGLREARSSAGNRDFVLRFRLQGESVQTGLLLHPDGGHVQDGYFLLMVQPPRRIVPDERPPRDLVFVVDVSGSMAGFPIATARSLFRELVAGLRPHDTFNLILFSGASDALSDRPVPATAESVARAAAMLDAVGGGGGTELLPALRRALALPAADGRSRSVVIITDGLVTVEEQAFDLIRRHLGEANVYTFGIGSSVNRHLLEGLARVGGGEPLVVTSEAEAPGMAARFAEYVSAPVLTELRIECSGFEARDMEPSGLSDLLAERPVVVVGRWKGARRGTIAVHGRRGPERFTRTLDVGSVAADPGGACLRHLWARERLRRLSDYEQLRPGPERAREIVAIGLEYNLLTALTSFVAVDELVRNPGGRTVKVSQPQPLLSGMSPYALGGQVGGVPEPEVWLMMALGGLMLAVKMRSRSEAVAR